MIKHLSLLVLASGGLSLRQSNDTDRQYDSISSARKTPAELILANKDLRIAQLEQMVNGLGAMLIEQQALFQNLTSNLTAMRLNFQRERFNSAVLTGNLSFFNL